MTKKRAALNLALAELENIYDGFKTSPRAQYTAITAIKEALAQSEQEPVAWMTQAKNFVHPSECTKAEAELYGWKPVYTSPPKRQPLETREIMDALMSVDPEAKRLAPGFEQFARAIEAKLKE